MEKKFLTYNLEELIEEKKFISWVLHGKGKKEWEEFIRLHPEFRKKASKGKEMILLLRDHYDEMQEDELLRIWQNIDHFNKENQGKTRRLTMRKTIAWAASVLLVITMGGLTYYSANKNKVYDFASHNQPTEERDARIVLSDGEEIALGRESSSISFNTKEEVAIINDNAVELSEKHVKGKGKRKSKMNEVVIPYGKMSEIELADGTRVWLNAGSKFAFPSSFTGSKREVYLEGEAYFEVAEDRQKAFIVNAAELDIEVLGTHFNVSAYPDGNAIETVLLEGSVSVNRSKKIGVGKEKVLLGVNQKASFVKGNNAIQVVDVPDAESYVIWIHGWLQFSKENLMSVLDRLERYYNMEVIVPEKFPSDELISGKLDLNRPKEDVLKTLQNLAGIEYRIEKDKIYISKTIKR